MTGDSYNTITKISEGLFKDKGSKFIAKAFPVETEEEVKIYLEEIKKEYYDARHHCYSYVLKPDQSIYRENDDGEPSGTAGKPIHGSILSHELTNILIVVVRYFGGTKLGVRGLINAYKAAAHEAINSNDKITKTINDIYEVSYEYPLMNPVMKIVKDENLEQIKTEFLESCRIEFRIRQKESQRVFDKFNEMHQVKIKLLRTE